MLRELRWSTTVFHQVCLWSVVATAMLVSAPPPTEHMEKRDSAIPEQIDFNRDVRPILSDRCFLCHGPDSSARRGDLRLDLRQDAVAKKAITPGNPADSELIQRIHATDAEEVMPPPSSKLTLNAREKSILERWIRQGAEYRQHWSFEPLGPTSPRANGQPIVESAGSIDRLIAQRLSAKGWSANPPASKEVWLRRATFDVTGLPPTPVETAEFLADRSEAARERVVDRLLGSPRFGEKMAGDWLDAARYADSFGYQADGDMHVWPYRDWVVRAFNDNLPFNQFITWQLAGDLLDAPTLDQRIATAFCRLHRMTNEGGSVEAEWRNESISDRVHTVGTAVLGLTMECARCHDHKYDPVSMKDYYALGAFFNSIQEWGCYNHSDFRPTPTLALPDTAQTRRLAELAAVLAGAEKAKADLKGKRAAAFAAWKKTAKGFEPSGAGLVGRYHLDDSAKQGGELVNCHDPKNPGRTSPANIFIPGRVGSALQFTGDDSAEFPCRLGVLERWQPFTVAFWLSPPTALQDCVVFHRTAGTDTGFNGLLLELVNRKLQLSLSRYWPGNAIGVRIKPALRPGAWTHVTLSYDGSSRAAGISIYLDGQRAPVEVTTESLTKNIEADRGHNAGRTGFTFGERFRSQGLKLGAVDEIVVYDRILAPLEIAQLAGRTAARPSEAELYDFFLAAEDELSRVAQTKLTAIRKEYFALQTQVFELMTMREQAEARPAFLLARGAYDAPKTNPVGRETPAMFPPFPPEAPRNRLGLARWLTSPNHPLTSRVAVNRVWQMFFGAGLVKSSENFGVQGDVPLHADVLDELARGFMGSGWDVKRLCKRILLADVYMQSSSVSAERLEFDPENIWLARGPSKRLSAESVRDAALFTGGLLIERQGGPPTAPYQPANIWNGHNAFLPAYAQDTGVGLYRRSLYTFWRRTSPPPNMLAFDAAGREVCSARRQPTMTPLQPLVLLNDPQFVEAARGLGERMLAEGGPDAASRISVGFQWAVGRQATPRERDLLVGLYEAERKRFQNDGAAAVRLLGVGKRLAPAKYSPADLAAAAVTANALFNLDSFVMLR